jgi:hypothetical protein
MAIDPAIANYGEQIFAKIPTYDQQQAAQADLQSKNMQLQVQREALAEHQRSLGEAQRAAALRQQVGQQYAGGDVSGGRKTAMQGGDFDLVSKLDNMDDSSRKRAFDISQHTAPLLLSLKNVPIEQTEQAMQSIAPQLQAAGFSPEHITQVTQQLKDPTQRDAAFNGILSSAQTIADYTAANADKIKQGFEVDKIAETKRHNLADEENAAAGHRLAAGLLPDANSSDGGIPTSGADAVYGFGKYAKPPAPISSMPMGQVQQFQRELINATRGKIGAFDKSGKPLGTGAVGSYQIVSGTLAKYAPQVFGQNWQNVPFTAENQDRLGAAIWNDAKNGDLHDVWTSMPHNAPGQYANIPWEQIRGKIAQGESGGVGKTGGGIIPGGKLDKKATLDPQSLSMMADQYLTGDKSVMQNLGRGNQGAENIVLLRREIYRQAQERGMSGKEIAATMADYAGLTAGSRTVGQKTANIQMAAEEAGNVIPLARAASDALPRNSFVPFAKAENMIRSGTNNPALAKFVTANNAVINTYARAISPTGTPTVSDKEHARTMIGTAQNKQAYNAVLSQMEQEIAAARAAPQTVRANMRAQISGKPNGQGQPIKMKWGG